MKDSHPNIISCYSRAQAIADGVLVDVSASGFARCLIKYPVAVTASVAGLLRLEDGDGRSQDRLLALLLHLCSAARSVKGDDRVEFDHGFGGDVHRVVAVCGPGDDRAPVITIMFRGED